MRIRLWIAGVAALAALSAQSQAAEKFAPKYLESSTQTKQAESKVDQTLTIAGMALETKTSSFAVSEATAGKRDADGKLSVTETVKVLQSELNLPGGLKLQFDSATPDKEADNPALNPILEIFRALVKYPVTTVVDRDGKIQSATLAESAQDKLSKDVLTYLGSDKLKKEHDQLWLFLPDKEVNVGDEWERHLDKNLGGGQTMNFKMKYVYAGPQTKDGKTLHKFTMTSQEVTYSLDPTANPMVQCSNSDLKIDKSSGMILYDPATGEILSRESSVTMSGKLTLVINGQELPSDLALTMTEKSTLQK